LFSDGLKQQAVIRSFDLENDVVLLEISGSGYRALPIGRSDSLSLGDEVITIGTPADLSLGQSVARGILSGKRMFEDIVYLQTDMAVSPGNSGGPLLNSKGEIVGIIQRKVVMSGVEGIGFAIPIERAASILRIQMDR
jgi:S1-C subfamily serine protease